MKKQFLATSLMGLLFEATLAQANEGPVLPLESQCRAAADATIWFGLAAVAAVAATVWMAKRK
jgi:hypothetical protein